MSNQEQFEKELRHQLGHGDWLLDIGNVSIGDNERMCFVEVSTTRFSLLIREYLYSTQSNPFAQMLIAGHTPYSVAKWWSLFSNAAEYLSTSYPISTFREKQQEPFVPRACFVHIGHKAIYTMSHDGFVEKEVHGTLSDWPDMHTATSRASNCDWFKPLVAKQTAFHTMLGKAVTKRTLSELNTTRLIKTALAIATLNEQWTTQL